MAKKANRKPTGIALSADKVIALRKRLGMSQEQLAERAFIDPKKVSLAERGESISLENMKKIANALGIGDDYEQILPPKSLDISPTVDSKGEERVTIEVRVVRASFPRSMPLEEIEKHTKHIFQELKLEGFMTDGVCNPNGKNGSLIVSGEITKPDARRVLAAFLAGKLDHLGFQSVSLQQTRIADPNIASQCASPPTLRATAEEGRGADMESNRDTPIDLEERTILHNFFRPFQIEVTLSYPVHFQYPHDTMPWFETLRRLIAATDKLVPRGTGHDGTVVMFLVSPKDAERLVQVFRNQGLDSFGITRVVFRTRRNHLACLDFLKDDTAAVLIRPPSVAHTLPYSLFSIFEMIRVFEGYERALNPTSSIRAHTEGT